MNLIRYNSNPWPIRWIDTSFDRALSDFFGPWPAWPAVRNDKATEVSAWAPRVDVREKDEAYVLDVEIPGAERDAISIEVKEGVLTLKGEKRRESTDEKEGVYRSERVYGEFTRRFSLPDDVNGDGIDAVYTDGVLTITLPKTPESAPKRIEVKAGEAKAIGTN